jgi:hypothetical protein
MFVLFYEYLFMIERRARLFDFSGYLSRKVDRRQRKVRAAGVLQPA